ncbi:AAA family ATPase [Paenibacillus aestuarii]|uniref:AAA family ATPase n=1 Tax=Paenibacillus aestuarii TaxID=516965 RepID=A0ABW0KAH2_9BACL|nr:AAA family ATPase [Paenibacillus aestuarii]
MTVQGYVHAWEHYQDELALLDRKLELLYKRRQKLTPDPQTDSFRGMFVSEDEFIRLIGMLGRLEEPDEEELDLLAAIQGAAAAIEERLAQSKQEGVFIPLSYLSSVFGLTAVEKRFVLLGLAVELDRKYERIFGFLQDDLTNKRPNVSLALQIACSHPEEMRAARTTFMAPSGRMARYLLTQEESGEQSLLSKPLILDKRIVTFLLDSGEMDPKLKPMAEMAYPDEELPELLVQQDFQIKLQRFIRDALGEPAARRKRLAFHLWGNTGAGKKLQVKHVCRHFGKPVLFVDLANVLLYAAAQFEEQLGALIREAILHQAVLVFTRLEALYPEEPDLLAQQRLGQFHDLLDGYGGMVFLLAGSFNRLSWKPKERILLEHELQVPDESERTRIWQAFANELEMAADVDWRIMSGKFRFTAGQIRRALTLARGYSAWQREPQAAAAQPAMLRSDALYKACHQQVQHNLERKASRIEPRYRWEDIILPPEQKDQLRNACNQVKYRGVVYSDWGFEKKLAYGKGLSMLFAGPPGTGKTMSAQVVAGDLQLELYKVDLSQVISKYIGETEKNLHEIFAEAQMSNAVLFFDETDALFGKRSEVKDSHDKYANIETAYLLQKMEEYQGITVLATNLLNNIDEAFLRRINYVIKFPFPDSDYREKIWQSMFPPAAPLSDDVDFKYLAQGYEIAGGNIKNVVLSSAFLAAEAGEPIRMQHIVKSIRHELQKSGKILARQEWEDY